VADAELAADPRATFRRLLSNTSGGTPPPLPVVEPGGGFLGFLPEPDGLPAWLTEQDLDTYVAEYGDRGFTGGLNWYRNIDRNWELTAAWHEAPITRPALYLAGEQDLVIAGIPADALVDALRDSLPDLRGATILPECGHWTQQERPDEVSAAIVDFAGSLS
jgi:pimeloyl-ACP methyl ester carboxylesterase